MAEITSLKDDLKIKRREIEKLKDQLDSINSKRTLFLPCGHTKILKSQEIQLIDSLYNEAVTRLLPEERKNEFILTRLKRKIFYILEAKYP